MLLGRPCRVTELEEHAQVSVRVEGVIPPLVGRVLAVTRLALVIAPAGRADTISLPRVRVLDVRRIRDVRPDLEIACRAQARKGARYWDARPWRRGRKQRRGRRAA